MKQTLFHFVCLLVLPIVLAFISGYFFKKELEKDDKRRMQSGELCKNCKYFDNHWQLCDIHIDDFEITSNCYCDSFCRKEGEK